MKIVLQRVLEASVTVEGQIIGEIGQGYVALLGVGHEDTRADVDRVVQKISKLRLFADENGKTNLSITDIGGEILVISQFTLYADCRKGNRPSFTDAAGQQLAEELYEYFIEAAEPYFKRVQHGKFGVDMKVALVNDGPFTVVIN